MSLLWNKIFMNFTFLCLSYVQEGAEISLNAQFIQNR